MRQDNPEPGLMKGVGRRVFVRSFFLETLWNYDKMQDVGFAFCMYPALARLYQDPEQRRAALRKPRELINTHPAMAPLLTGMVTRLERDADPVAVQPGRKRIMATLAAWGDRVFWGTVKPLAAVWGTLLSLWFFGSVAGAVTALMIYNVPQMIARGFGFAEGWSRGLDVLTDLRSTGLTKAVGFMRGMLSLGLGMVAGAAVLSALAAGKTAAHAPWPGVAVGVLVVLVVAAYWLLHRRAPLSWVIYSISICGIGIILIIGWMIR
ncbi:MAG: PTS system mannose/fructose/sorbose family transporter subunit IID [Deltaproteobacteria bacterium]|nr:PTS system mannose/fructose/sorbose family transporter subunit IID [Deltaproteobacteria bacterium]